MDDSLYQQLLNTIKLFKKQSVNFTEYGTQNFHNLYDKHDTENKFKLLINRKGHLRTDVLTYQMISEKHGIMVRLDMTGTPHDDKNGNSVETPHLHIFDEEHNMGRWAIPLSEITDQEIIYELLDSLTVFLSYNTVETKNLKIPIF